MSRRSAASPAPLSLVKRRRPASHGGAHRLHKVSLEKVAGLTCVTNNGLSVSSETGCVAYPAGCVAVLHHPNNSGQQLHILNNSKKPISAITLSPDGKYLAIGEYGHQPSVQVWNVAGSPHHMSELKAHKYGVQCMAFSPSMKYLVSVGYQHDMHIQVWHWRTGRCVATNKITSKVYGLSFSEDSKYFVTVGNRRVRFWAMLPPGRDENYTAPLKGRSAVLGDLQDNCFVAVGCGRGSISSSTYALTRTGVLCKFDRDRSLDQFVNVQARPGRSLSLCESYVICGCGEGVVRLFDPCTLDYLLTMPLPHPLGVDVSVSLNSQVQQKEDNKFPDVVATALDTSSRRLSVVYSDHSRYEWDMANLRQIRKILSSLHHSACIWDLCLYPSSSEGEGGLLPPSTLITCSTDNTARFWNMDSPQLARQGSSLVRSLYSKELMKVIYTSPDLSSLSDTSKYPGDASAVADLQRGVRCVQFHPRGHQLALGDRAGNIRVYDLQFMDVVFEVEAHDAEVLCIQYSPLHQGLQFMCSASRDRLIHVFTTGDHYKHIQTIDDHSASITALRFTVRGDLLQLLSCGADKSIMFRTLQKSPSLEFQRTSHIACKASIYDVDIDVVGKHMVTVGQDRLLRIYQLSSGKQKTVIKVSTGDEGSLLKVAMDPSGLYVACSSSDKTVFLFDFYSGECLAKLFGHSEVVTQVRFSTDCRFLYSVSGDGCIFVWRLSEDLTQTMHDRLTEIGAPVTTAHQLTPIKAPPTPLRRETYSVSKDSGTPSKEEVDSSDEVQFRLSVSQLPAWAQRQVQARPSIAQSFSTSSLEKVGEEGGRGKAGVPVAGCWAERVAGESILNRTASAPDIPIIDLTSPEKEREAEGKEGEQEDLFFPPPLVPAVDPSVFKVTTPEKKAKSRPATESVQEEEEEEEEEEEGEGSGESKSSSPEGPKDYLKTTFESLSSVQAADAFFARSPPDPHDLRLSISARFFSQSGKCKLPGWSRNVTACRKSWSSPDLPIPPLQTSTVDDPIPLTEETEGEGEKADGEGENMGEREKTEGEKMEEATEVAGEEGKDEGEGVAIDTTALGTTEMATKRSPAIQEEINKTRRRLEELGYGSLAKGPPSVSEAGASHPLPPPPPQPHPSPLPSECRKSDDSGEDDQSLLCRVTQCITGINEGFRNMVALHQMAVEGLGGGEREECAEEKEGERGRRECEEVVGAIATAVVSLKRRSVSMANRHRRRWREVVQGRGRETDSSGSSSRESLASGEKEGGEVPEAEVEERGRQSVEGGTEAEGEKEVAVMAGEDVLALLERYSQQLVDIVRERTAPLSQ